MKTKRVCVVSKRGKKLIQKGKLKSVLGRFKLHARPPWSDDVMF